MKKLLLPFILLILSYSFLCAQSYEELIVKSLEFTEKNDYKQAEKYLKEALSLEPDHRGNALLLVNLGGLQRYMGKYDEALISYNAAIDAMPQNKTALQSRAALLSQLEQYDEAIADYDSIVAIDSADYDAHCSLGLLTLYHNHNFEEATDHFRKAAEIEPDSTQAQLGLAMIARWQDNCPKAKNIYDILLQTYPKRGDIYYLRAECLAREDAIADALYDLDKAIDLGYETPQVFMLRGQLHIEQMDCISADFDFKKAQQLGASAKVVAAALLMCK